MNHEDRKHYAQLDNELAILYRKMAIIEAKHTKAIWTDSTYDCDRKDVLRNAELTLRLANNEEFRSLQEQVWELERQQKELDYIPLEDIPDLKF